MDKIGAQTNGPNDKEIDYYALHLWDDIGRLDVSRK